MTGRCKVKRGGITFVISNPHSRKNSTALLLSNAPLIARFRKNSTKGTTFLENNSSIQNILNNSYFSHKSYFGHKTGILVIKQLF